MMRNMRINRHALIEIRERSGLTQVALAERISSSPGYIHDIETGRRNASAPKIKDLAMALACPITAIIEIPSAAERVS